MYIELYKTSTAGQPDKVIPDVLYIEPMFSLSDRDQDRFGGNYIQFAYKGEFRFKIINVDHREMFVYQGEAYSFCKVRRGRHGRS